MSSIAATIRGGWNGTLHPVYPLLVALIPVVYTFGYPFVFGRKLPPLGSLPFLEALIYAFVALGVWSTIALWRCAQNGPPIWPVTWRGLAVLLGIHNVLLCGAVAIFMMLITLRIIL